MPIANPSCGRLFRLQVSKDFGTGVEWGNVALIEELSDDFAANVVEQTVKEKLYPIVLTGCSAPSYSVSFTALFSSAAEVDGVAATIDDDDTEFAASSHLYGIAFLTDALNAGTTNSYRIVDGSATALEFDAYVESFSRSADGATKFSVTLKAVDAVTINGSST